MVKPLASAFLGLLIALPAWTIGGLADEPGRRLYDERCSRCHGAEGRGGSGPRLVPFEWSYEQALEQIRRPVCDMPPVPATEVSDAEIAQVVAYLKTIE